MSVQEERIANQSGNSVATGTVLDFIEKRRGTKDKLRWRPFEVSSNFNSDWWDRTPYYKSDPWYVQVLDDGVEVGRVEFDNKVYLSHYGVDPKIELRALQIELIEVSNQHRRQHIGTEIVREIAVRHPGRTLVAFSEGADDFWKSLGWHRYEHLTKSGCQSLFLQP